jgi:hypothetical protein
MHLQRKNVRTWNRSSSETDEQWGMQKGGAFAASPAAPFIGVYTRCSRFAEEYHPPLPCLISNCTRYYLEKLARIDTWIFNEERVQLPGLEQEMCGPLLSEKVQWQLVVELGLGPCHLRAGHGTVFWHDLKYGMTWNILNCTSTTRTWGLCRAQNLGTAGYMARPASWAVLGPARHENDA